LASELRWILLALCAALIAGIWWWSARKASHAPGNSVLREPILAKTPENAHAGTAQDFDDEPGEIDFDAPAIARISHGAPQPTPASQPALTPPPTLTTPAKLTAEPMSRGMRISPLEPLEIHEAGHQPMRTGEFDHVPVLDAPMMINPDPSRPDTWRTAPSQTRTIPEATRAAEHEMAATDDPTRAAEHEMAATDDPARAAEHEMPATDDPTGAAEHAGPARSPQSPPAAAPSRPPAPARHATPPARPAPAAAAPAEVQRIVTLRVCAPGEARWSGAELSRALELNGLAYGRYQVFHRKHTDGQTLFCVASLIEPGTFDLEMMGSQEFRGVTLFAVLPGPLEALATLDDLLATARGLADELSGMVQDAKGMPLSPQRAAGLREDVARFQAALPRG
jgi:cell division protein ZipA